MICRRFFLIVFPVIMLIPAFAVVLGLGFVPPEFSSSYYDEGHTIYDGLDELPDRTRPSLGDELTAFIGSSGDEYTAEQKLDLLQKLADYETFCLGSARVQVVSKRLEESVYGSYSPGNTYLTVDYKHLNTSPTSAIIRTLLHEVYHSYQFYIIIKTDWKSDLAKTGYFDKALDWAKNLLSYKDGYNDYDAYSEQPLEADAADFAKTEWIILRNEAGLSA